MAITIQYDLPAILAGIAAYTGGTAGPTAQQAATRNAQNAQFQQLTAGGVSQGFNNGFALGRDLLQQRYQAGRDATLHGYDMDRFAAVNAAELDRQSFSQTGMRYDDLVKAAGESNLTVPQLIDKRETERISNRAAIETATAVERGYAMLPVEQQRAAMQFENEQALQEHQANIMLERIMNEAGFVRGFTLPQQRELNTLTQRMIEIPKDQKLSPEEQASEIESTRRQIFQIQQNKGFKERPPTAKDAYDANVFEMPNGSRYVVDGRIENSQDHGEFVDAWGTAYGKAIQAVGPSFLLADPEKQQDLLSQFSKAAIREATNVMRSRNAMLSEMNSGSAQMAGPPAPTPVGDPEIPQPQPVQIQPPQPVQSQPVQIQPPQPVQSQPAAKIYTPADWQSFAPNARDIGEAVASAKQILAESAQKYESVWQIPPGPERDRIISAAQFYTEAMSNGR